MAVVLSPVSLSSFYDPYDGSVLMAKLYFYKTGTLDPFTVYTDAAESIPHAQPVLTGGSGRVPPVFVNTPDPYRVRTFDQYDQLLEDIDGIPGVPEEGDGGGGGGTPSDGTLPPPASPLDKVLQKTGDMWCSFSNVGPTARAVRANGQTIGPPGSGATERANTDTYALFMFLWGQDALRPDNLLAVIPARGDSAQGDWDDGHKQLALPDLRGRAPFGLDGMGNTIVNRLRGVIFAAGTADKLGSSGGTGLHQLNINELPAHTHVVTDPTHTHVVIDPTHNHPIGDPQHAHPITDLGHTHAGISSSLLVQSGALGTAANIATTGTSFRSAALQTATTGITQTNLAKTNIDVWEAATGITNTATATGISNQNTGADFEHPNMPPFLLLTWYIHL